MIFKNLALMLGGFSIVISLTTYSWLEFYSKPLFHAVLLIAYSLLSKKIKPLFYLFYLSAMAVEYMAKSTIVFNILWVVLGYTICFSSGIILLFPLLKKGKLRLKGVNRIFVLIVITSLGYIILSTYITFLSELNTSLFFASGLLPFTAFLASCFYITSVYNHPNSIYLFLTGIGYSITCLLGLIILALQVQNVMLSGLLNLSELIAQFCFVFFMIDFNEVLNNRDIIALED
ncbi:hypothetical protein [Lacinutrix sp. Bg11-31]|uniref:hypothetical protein n=1 Tax=Lacinutrix sp. Bg11-31 TaxID=2057808 RepID=UPI000C304FA9|nr:hypothetical protein [Lacinutrix sp. Bg11-31]AUC83054.1 hypothetical protein CW733_13320 [Lacinutrix sp. Bg11-31]